MTSTTSYEKQLTIIARAIERLQHSFKEQNLKIASLIEKLKLRDDNAESSKGRIPHSNSMPENTLNNDQNDVSANPTIDDASITSLSIQQLQDMIVNCIREQYSGVPQSARIYSKPYTERINILKMPIRYQPPKLQQFDGKGNPKQHVAHFIETCGNDGANGDLLVKQFVRSLKRNAFDWYTDLKAEGIDNWEQMEQEFLNRFYSTRRTIGMLELTNTKQMQGEPVVNYINRWRALSLDCNDHLSEISAVDACMQVKNGRIIPYRQQIAVLMILVTNDDDFPWLNEVQPMGGLTEKLYPGAEVGQPLTIRVE
ncbi:uncharacterized protein LOC132296149 [Cornus florida]|uniref:uncharacterized protein LOC132296149 n=1 Tax=Cornus florida TaxID=4283 RepID=UPI00289FF621|nr:uncharacterized protein LOC132296149 [Cornus florida]